MKPIRVHKLFMPVIVIVTLLGSVQVARVAGLWQTSGRDDIMLNEEGEPDPEGIKGWMTLQNLSDNYGLPLDAVYALIGAGPDISPDTALKDLESVLPGMEVSSVRAGVAAYQAGLWTPDDGPYGMEGGSTPVEPTPMPTPEPTAEPSSESTPAPEQRVEHSGEGSGDGTGAGRTIVLPADGSALPGSEIKGWMTILDVVDSCQVPLEVLISELGLPDDIDTHLSMRDLSGQLGIEVLAVREVVDRYQAGQ